MPKSIYINTGELSGQLLKKPQENLDSAYQKLASINNCPMYLGPTGYCNLYPTNISSEILHIRKKLKKLLEKVDAYAKVLGDGPEELVSIDSKIALKNLKWYDFLFNPFFQGTAALFLDLLPGEVTTVLDDLWSDVKQYLGQLGFFEDILEGFFDLDLGDKPKGIEVLSYLSKVEKILNVDPSSWDSLSTAGDEIIDSLEAVLSFCGLKDWVMTGTGFGGTEAALLIDLSVAGTKNCIENTEESINLVLDLIQSPDATFMDYLDAFSKIRYNLGDGILVEGFLDVVFDKADIIGGFLNMEDYIETKTGGSCSSVKDVYNDFWQVLNDFPKETISAMWKNLKGQIAGPLSLKW